ncbi:MAG TPA: outer-membrane lipoprotein carrier protein LolA [Aridibacter sp.]|nr:outer-membrane lipoprotein carrier protein LolA [Aridibacter sp.]
MVHSSVKVGFSGVLALLVLAFASPETAKAQGVATGVLQRMQDHNRSIRTLNADLRRVKYDVLLKLTTLDQSGTLYYIPGETNKAYVRIDWKDPDETLLVVLSKFWFYQKNLNQYYHGKINNSDKAKGVDALSFLGKSRKELAAEFRTIFEGREKVDGVAADHIRLIPKGEAKFREVELWVDTEGMPIRIKIIEKNNDSTTLAFSSIKKDIRMNADLFKWRPPSNAKKINV